MENGKLYLLPSTLGSNESKLKVLPGYNLEIARTITIFIVEQVRTARRFLAGINHPLAIDELIFLELNKHTPDEQNSSYLDYALNGKSVGLLSEAGTPCIADPGAAIVKMAHQYGLQVVPLVGPNSILLALMASGFNGQNFVFHGYLPIEKLALVKKIKEMEGQASRFKQTQLFIETPYRNMNLFDVLLKICNPHTLLCVASNLTLENESVRTMEIAEWKKEKVDFHKKPTVFLLF